MTRRRPSRTCNETAASSSGEICSGAPWCGAVRTPSAAMCARASSWLICVRSASPIAIDSEPADAARTSSGSPSSAMTTFVRAPACT